MSIAEAPSTASTPPSSSAPSSKTVRSLVPARLDRLPWTRFHWLVICGLGVSWILDELEIQIVALVGTVLQDRATLHLTTGDVGLLGSIYLLGEVVGALLFGRITDLVGRKKMFIACLGLYLVFSGLGAFSFNLWFLLGCRFVAGMGIGGEYTAINSAIDELIPSHYRGRVDIAVNGTYWAGAMIGAFASILLLNPHLLPINLGWRLGFFIGPVLGLCIIYLRRTIPESPRWLMTHGRQEEANKIVDDIEARIEREGVHLEPVSDDKAIEVTGIGTVSYVRIAKTMLRDYPSRSFLGFSMMVTQAFLYNAIFFTYALVLTNFYHVPASETGWYFFPFAFGNLLGPLTIGHLFDTIGRRKMILFTYCVSAILLAISASCSTGCPQRGDTDRHVVPHLLPRICRRLVCVSHRQRDLPARAARSGDLLLLRHLATCGRRCGADDLRRLIGCRQGSGTAVDRLLLGAAIMFTGGLIAWFFGVNAERRPLEDIATPLSAAPRRNSTSDAVVPLAS